VITSRFMNDIPAPPFWRMALRGNHLPDDQPVDRWQICRFTPPSHVMIEVGVALAGHGGYEAPKDKKVYSIVVDFITPETETSMWYFWGMARNFNAKDKALTAQIREGQGKIFAEDLEMLERQQANLLRLARAPTCSCSTSTPAACSRARCWTAWWPERRPWHDHGHQQRCRCASPRKKVRGRGHLQPRAGRGVRPARCRRSRRLARGRAPARRPDTPVFAVQRPRRDAPLPDRGAA
jgi:hypothetical protein